MDLAKYTIPANQLRWTCDPCHFDFNCTKNLAPLQEFIGQDRAIGAIQFGLSMDHDGYNIYVAGLTGTGKNSVVKSYIEKLVAERQAGQNAYYPKDWCYLHNFVDHDRPKALSLPQGQGRLLRQAVQDLLRNLKEEFARAFSSQEYQAQKRAIAEEGQSEQQRLFKEIENEAHQKGFSIQITSVGPSVIPLKDGKPYSQPDIAGLEESEREEIQAKLSELMKKLQATVEQAQEIDRLTAGRLEHVEDTMADHIISRLFESVGKKFAFSEDTLGYLADLRSYTFQNMDVFKVIETAQPNQPGPGITLDRDRDPFLPFQVNVFVDNSLTQGPPVVVESNPSYTNLFGMIERRFLMGGYLTDHTMCKTGALQLANGGYLLLSARDVMIHPGVWMALKRALKTKEIRIEDPMEAFGLMAPQGLRPQPIPLDVKVMLIGDSLLYQMLSIHDEDFWEIFKVKADFNFEVDKTPENIMAYASFIAGFCEEGGQPHFDRTGVARVVEYAARIVADQDKLSTRFAWIKELIRESEYWARKDGADLVAARHVNRALAERRFRHDLPNARLIDMVRNGTVMIDVHGTAVGQVNGLNVYLLGDMTFGRPSRISCSTFLGRGGIINIERESHLSGNLHDKGVLILSGYLGRTYAQKQALSVSASICFEQSYEGIDGDSASAAELCTILSSLSGIPIKQGIALTGSINQSGELQPIGGVNYKIEGFFMTCRELGLTGNQGVIIPRRNIRNLMLREEVVDAVNQGRFHIYAVDHIDEAMQVLTGKKAGQRRKDGSFPKGSINFMVETRLRELSKREQRSGPATSGKQTSPDQG